jgi:transcriptional regulator with XRE-family HTH domain
MTTGERIKLARKAKGLTQKQLGKILNVTQATIQQYESGTPKLDTLKKIAMALGCATDNLIGQDVSVEAIEFDEFLEHMKSTNIGGEDALRLLFKNGFESLLFDIADLKLEYRRNSNIQTESQKEYNNLQDGVINPALDEKGQPIPGLHTVCLSLNSYMDFELQKLTQLFCDMVKTIITEGDEEKQSTV